MKKALLVWLAIFFLVSCGAYKQTRVTLPDGFVINTRVADTPEKTEKGLMFVKHLPENEGMLFVFDKEDVHYFWMKNTLIDLDILFLAPDGTINQLYGSVPHTYTYTPESEVPVVPGYGQYVLEMAAGTSARHGLKEGDKISFILP